MSYKSQFISLAQYNQDINIKVYEASSKLDLADLSKDRGAFFGSIIGTLNHIMVGDLIWLNRFSQGEMPNDLLVHTKKQPKPNGLDDILYYEISELFSHRRLIDQEIIDFVKRINESALDFPLTYRNSKGIEFTKRFCYLLLHFFNHQTHHRGQVTTLLSQEGISVGVTDLLAILPNEKVSASQIKFFEL